MAKISNPLIIIGGKENFGKYHIEQVIDGDDIELYISDITTETENNYYIGQVINKDGTSELYIVDI